MSSRTVYGIGETICDIIFKDNQPQTAKAGGSSFNAMVSLGRMGVTTSFISKIGDDHLGQMILSFMKENHIAEDNMTIGKGHKTDIALAFLDNNGDATYSFYKEYDKQFVEAKIPCFQKDDILLMGSYFSLNPLLRPLIERVLDAAQKAQAIIYYDPNFRSSHAHEVNALKPAILHNLRAATIVRGSDEDFGNIFENKNQDSINHQLQQSCSQYLLTKNKDGVDVWDKDTAYHFPAISLEPVSTIGAGDSFNAGFIYALIKNDIRYDAISHLNHEQWESLVSTAVLFATDVCQSYDNYISPEFAKKLNNQ